MQLSEDSGALKLGGMFPLIYSGSPVSAKLRERAVASVAWPLSKGRLRCMYVASLVISHQVDRHTPRHGIVGFRSP